MQIIKTRLATLSDFPAIAAFIEVNNRAPASQCIQSSTGEAAEFLLKELENLHGTGEICFAIAAAGNQLGGVLGCEFAEHESRGWLRGPLIDTTTACGAGADGFHKMAHTLYLALIPSIPASITILDSFLNLENARGQAFYAAQGFHVRNRHHVYTAARPGALTPPDKACIPMQPGELPAVIALHNAVFPGTRTGEDVLYKLDENHRVWVYLVEDQPAGYIHAVIEPWAEGGYVEFLGVRAEARGRGIGAALLATALHWCFAERQVPEVGLTVDDTNTNARSLYERAGFRLKYSGVNQRLERQ